MEHASDKNCTKLRVWNVRVEMIGRQPEEMWRCWGRSQGRGRKTWRECVKDDMDELGLHPEWAVYSDMRGFISGQTSDPS